MSNNASPRQPLGRLGLARFAPALALALLGIGSPCSAQDASPAGARAAASAPASPKLEPVVHVGRIKAPLSAVWAAYTTGEGLRRWMVPHAEFDLRLGGLMRTHYSPQGQLGDPGTIENKVLAYEPERMVTLQIHRVPQGFPFPNAGPRMWTVISFAPIDAQTTEVRTASQGWDASEESQRMRGFFERGNAFTMTALQRHFDPAPK